MILDHKREFIFVHVPRTGGYSAYDMLGGKTDGPMHPPRSRIGYDYYSFGFMRNPWDRMYSLYRKQKILPKYVGVGFKEYLTVRLLNNAARNCALWFLEGCDFIGRYENLNDDWNTIQIAIGMEPMTLPHVNQCGEADYRNHYDAEMIDFITLHHKPDIEYNGYTF